MRRLRKHHLGVFAALAFTLGFATTAMAQSPATAQSVDREERLDTLFEQLAEPDREDWRRIEGEITRLWSQSGSETMDLLFQRGHGAIGRKDYAAAVDHFSSLTDLAPDFAEGWNARATTFFLMDEYALSISDIERTLALNPRHFGALSGLRRILEEMGEIDLALKAAQAAHDLTPNRPELSAAVSRLERLTGAADL